MYIPRDITQQLQQATNWIQILLGPRQCGKSTLFATLAAADSLFKEITFDDFQLRQLANRDPALFLQQFEPPLVLDEIQYVPNLFPELKKQIDQLKKIQLQQNKSAIKITVLFRLTGSNQIALDKNVKESLVGRASYYYLNTLSVHEILNALPNTRIADILFKGGWPELYLHPQLMPVNYLNNYVRSYVEKDIVLTAGIQKLSQFNTVLGLLAARTGQLLDYSAIANDSGVSSVTVKEWVALLERADLIYLLKPYFNNLNKRLVKTPKIYFLDTGLAARLQGWQDSTPLLTSPQIGSLFETLVLAEIVKFIRNYQKDWQLYFFRTRDGDEVDFVLKIAENEFYSFEVKLALQGISEPVYYPAAYRKQFAPKQPLVIVTFGGQSLKISKECLILPIAQLHDYLQAL